MIVKEDQILVDVEMIFKEIEAAGGDWKKVWEEFKSYLKEVKEEKQLVCLVSQVSDGFFDGIEICL